MKHLKDEHDRLRSMSRAYTAAAEVRHKPDIHAILQQRKTFSAAFRAHLSAEQDALARMREGAQGEVAAQLEACSRRMRELILRHSEVIREWSPRRIDAEWAAYCSAVREQRQYFLAHLDWEEKELHPALARAAAERSGTDGRA